MSRVEFKTPTDGRSKRPRRVLKYDYWAAADQLKAHPGEWALCFEHVSVAVPNAIRRGVRALPLGDGPDQFEMKTENNTYGQNRTCDVYLKYGKKPRNPQLQT